MVDFLDDRYTSQIQINTFEDGYNHFWIDNFNFMASYDVGLILGGDSAQELLKNDIDIF